MAIADFLNSCDVLGQTCTMINIKSVIILEVLEDLSSTKVKKNCILLDFESIHLNKWTLAFIKDLTLPQFFHYMIINK